MSNIFIDETTGGNSDNAGAKSWKDWFRAAVNVLEFHLRFFPILNIIIFQKPSYSLQLLYEILSKNSSQLLNFKNSIFFSSSILKNYRYRNDERMVNFT